MVGIPIIHGTTGATERLGFAACNSEEWLAHHRTVGKIVLGELAVLVKTTVPCRTGPQVRSGLRPLRNSPITTTRRENPGSTSQAAPILPWGVGYVDDDGFASNGPENLHDHLRGREHLPQMNTPDFPRLPMRRSSVYPTSILERGQGGGAAHARHRWGKATTDGLLAYLREHLSHRSYAVY